MRKLSFIIIFIILLVSGCQDKKDKSKDWEVVDKTAEVENKIVQLGKDINALYSIVGEMNNKELIFSPSEKGQGYSVAHTNLGSLFVSLEHISKYADGYKVTFKIGNPNYAIFDKVKVTLYWGHPMPSENLLDWVKSLRKNIQIINKPLIPGIWNKVEFILSPATAQETGYMSLSLEPNQVLFSKDMRKMQ